jgi:hypothetical protein
MKEIRSYWLLVKMYQATFNTFLKKTAWVLAS